MSDKPNTIISFMYRDACNYKTYDTVAFDGPVTDEQVARFYAACEEDDWFVAEQVGLINPAREDGTFSSRFPDEEDDHGYVELVDVSPTRQRATGGPISEFLTRFEAAAADGWNPAVAIEAAGGWTDPDLAAQLRGA